MASPQLKSTIIDPSTIFPANLAIRHVCSSTNFHGDVDFQTFMDVGQMIFFECYFFESSWFVQHLLSSLGKQKQPMEIQPQNP